MNSSYFKTVVTAMRRKGIECAPGLAAAEIEAAETEHGFRFPPDLRALLAHVLPVGERFPDWRSPRSAFIRNRLAWPADSICFDIEHDAFWFPAWGQRPSSIERAQAIARDAIHAQPFLIPIYAHRYLPASPCEPGNPVFSVYQTDIIYYGLDLSSYLFAEFEVPNPFPVPDSPREIPFWGELERLNG